MVTIKNFKESPFSKLELESLFRDVNDTFDPSLEERVQNRSDVRSISQYIDKVLENGFVFIQYEEYEIHGFITFYANDFVNKQAYIPLLSVRDMFRKKGVGQNLLRHILTEIKNKGMNEIVVKTWIENIPAKSLYLRNGFKLIESSERDLTFKLNFI